MFFLQPPQVPASGAFVKISLGQFCNVVASLHNGHADHPQKKNKLASFIFEG